jgi:hypothetical protein
VVHVHGRIAFSYDWKSKLAVVGQLTKVFETGMMHGGCQKCLPTSWQKNSTVLSRFKFNRRVFWGSPS